MEFLILKASEVKIFVSNDYAVITLLYIIIRNSYHLIFHPGRNILIKSRWVKRTVRQCDF